MASSVVSEDLAEAILGHISTRDRATLRACSCIAKIWQVPSQKRLVSAVEINTPSAAEMFGRTLHEQPWMVGHVRKLSILTKDISDLVAIHAAIGTPLYDLHSLDIDLFQSASVGEHLQTETLPLPNFHTIQKLSALGLSFVSLEQMQHVFSQFQRMTSLSIGGEVLLSRETGSYAGPLCTLRLTTLHVEDLEHEDIAQVCLMLGRDRTSIPSGVTVLRIDIRALWHVGLIECAPTLRELQLWGILYDHQAPRFAEVLRKLPQLSVLGLPRLMLSTGGLTEFAELCSHAPHLTEIRWHHRSAEQQSGPDSVVWSRIFLFMQSLHRSQTLRSVMVRVWAGQVSEKQMAEHFRRMVRDAKANPKYTEALSGPLMLTMRLYNYEGDNIVRQLHV